MPRILVITDHGDVHVPPVAEHLAAGMELTTIDTARVMLGEDLSFVQTKSGPRVFYRGEHLDDVVSVWYRKPSPLPETSIPVAAEYQTYAWSSLDQHGKSLNVQFRDATWVSDYYSLCRAKPKAGQLATAQELGFAVPETVMTSSENLARKFVRDHGTCIAKPLAVRFPHGKAMYATLVTTEDDLDYAGIAVDPQILQTYIEPATELRVTVVGGEVFAAEVHGGEPQRGAGGFRVRDWRAGADTFWAAPARVSADLEDKCRQYLAVYGLRFGAFDFVVDRAGVPWFLECNGNGQWLFIEDATGQPISQAMARLLTGGARAAPFARGRPAPRTERG